MSNSDAIKKIVAKTFDDLDDEEEQDEHEEEQTVKPTSKRRLPEKKKHVEHVTKTAKPVPAKRIPVVKEKGPAPKKTDLLTCVKCHARYALRNGGVRSTKMLDHCPKCRKRHRDSYEGKMERVTGMVASLTHPSESSYPTPQPTPAAPVVAPPTSNEKYDLLKATAERDGWRHRAELEMQEVSRLKSELARVREQLEAMRGDLDAYRVAFKARGEKTEKGSAG